ncbi:hypothetical protein PF011_g9855 [Phytophthora fragariae]|uniref:Calcineurin-like phosphoesterase domain-containing protein n=2 Tax=Phytophthora fragariae TaxID=53985 RepID=A0A6A3KTN8_9STRA|nr:hypothetical protein PF011_g9855 [Phytophthora fragariae]
MMSLMSRVPYMVLVGNHEAECHSPRCQISRKKRNALGNYTAYNTRFKMPYEESSGALNMWHSFDHGPIHFTSISSETDYPGAPTNRMTLWVKNGDFGDQLSWIEADLKKAHANRANNDVPTEQTALIQAAFEELFLKYEVDVVLAGHKHYYERELPVANSKAVMDGVSDDYAVYDNPQAPVHILTGGAGQVEGMSEPPSNTASWNAASDYEHFGFSMLEANRTTLVWNYSEELAKYIAESCANLSNESEEPLDDSDDSSDDDVFDFAESQSADKFVEPPVEVPRSYRTQDLQGGMLVAGDCVLFTNWAFKRQLRRVRRLAPIPERGDAGEYEQLPSDEECRPKGVHSGKIVEL